MKVKCAYCKKEYPKGSKEIRWCGPIICCYLCSDCRKINPCGSPFCPPRKNLHEH